MIIITNPVQDEKTTRAIIRDLLKYGYQFPYLQNYPVATHFTTYELKAMWKEEKEKMCQF